MLVDAKGIPLAIQVSGANTHDVTQVISLVDGVPKVRGKKRQATTKTGQAAKGIEAMTPSRSAISSDAVGSSHNSRNGGPSMALGSARRAGMSSEPWPGSSAMGRLGSAPRGGPRTTKRWSS